MCLEAERHGWRSAAGRSSHVAEGEADELRGLLDAAETRYRTEGQTLADTKSGAA